MNMNKKEKTILLDGAVGTSLWEKAEKCGYEKVPVWRYNLEHPEIVSELLKEYIEAGAQIVLANTFGANKAAVKRSTDYEVEDVVRAGVKLAKEAVEGTDVLVALSVGPLSVLLEPYGDLTEEEAEAFFEEQIGSGMKENPDIIVLQTFLDLEMMKVAVKVAKSYHVPVFCMMTFEAVGKTIMGNSVQDVIDALEPLGVASIGLNCSLGPDSAVAIIKEFAAKTNLPIIFKPNAGKPILSSDGTTTTPYNATHFAAEIEQALPYVTYVGGCCGCNAEFIEALKQIM